MATITAEGREPGSLTIITIAEAAEYLHVSPQTLKRHLWDGNIPHFRVGKDFRFVREELDIWIRLQTKL